MSFPSNSKQSRKIHPFHSSLLSLKFVAFLSILFYSNLVSAAEVTLAWDANTEPDLAGYMIYYGFASRSYDYVVDVGDQTTFTLSGLEDGYTYYFAVTAYDTEDLESDFSNEVTRSFEFGNQPPIADAGPDQTVDEGVMVTLSGLNSIDPDDGIASYFWEQTDGPAVDLSNASSAEASFLDTDVGTDDQSLTFKLTVTDNGDLQSSDFCVVNISWINEPPMADAGPDLTGSWVSLNPFQSGPKSWIQGILNVENWGTQMAQSSLIYFYLSTDEILDKTDIKIAKTTLDILEAGQSIDISFKAKLPDREFNNYIIAQIDSLKAVLETDETNNIIVSWPL